jgi:hypothetical protein
MPLRSLIAARGEWRGSSRLYGPGPGKVEDSASTLHVVPMLHDTFVRLDYDWALEGVPPQGSLLLGVDPATGVISCHWIDTFHYGRGVMALTGRVDGDPGDPDWGVEVRGSYPAPPGVDWGWRITITCDEDALQVAMFNIAPDGVEYPAVEAAYARA